MALTQEEYYTRAMLLGMWYVPRVGYYLDKVPTNINTKRFDADTLEPLTYPEVLKRGNVCDKYQKPWRELTDEQKEEASQ